MNIIIHRGTHQIGGCITEIKTDQARIFIDMGEELPNEDTPSVPIDIDGVTGAGEHCDAIFFTHNHGDHIGMFSRVKPDIPLYLGETAKEIYQLLQTHLRSPHLYHLSQIKTFRAFDKIVIKDITMTPFLVDHSAYDAYMFLIEAQGKKILHTGDFRNHGYKGKGLFPTLQKYVGQVDVLITEGTTLSRKHQEVLTESELQAQAWNLMQEKKYIFVVCSSTNIDRIAAFYHSNPQGRYFICDEYQRKVLELVRAHGAKYTKLYDLKKVHVFGNNLVDKMKSLGFCMLVRNSDKFKVFMSLFNPDECLVIYSMWQGYLKDKKNGLADFLSPYQYISLHTSGHATPETIKQVIELTNPKIGVIPIHSERPGEFMDILPDHNVILLSDKQIFYL